MACKHWDLSSEKLLGAPSSSLSLTHSQKHSFISSHLLNDTTFF